MVRVLARGTGNKSEAIFFRMGGGAGLRVRDVEQISSIFLRTGGGSGPRGLGPGNKLEAFFQGQPDFRGPA